MAKLKKSLIRSFLIGLVAGQRGITPLASIAAGTRSGEISPDLPLQGFLSNPVVAAGTAVLAAAEMMGDKMKTAPDRIVPIGLAVRGVTSAYAGAALAPRDKRVIGAAVALGTALVSSYIGWRLRCAAMSRYGQSATGFVEDAIILSAGLAIASPTSFHSQNPKSGRRTQQDRGRGSPATREKLPLANPLISSRTTK